ncbi:hypothetical protein MNAN1_002845 [Malassezia nana]|uniref:DH domain-containing protein n=1 Tax=Malassezia nana TaxID=180528 RepID=A0AAF0ENF2_9BASI|nr:hypothetical protein MNAN1_002845 [Malassezia nana]
MFPAFRRNTPDDESESPSTDDHSRPSWRRAPDISRGAGEPTSRRVSSNSSDTALDTPDMLLTRNNSNASRHSRASSNASNGPLSRKSSLQRTLHTAPLQEIPEPRESGEPPGPPRALFLRARTKSIDHMHRLLHLRQFSKEGKGKSKKKNTPAVPNSDPGPIEAPPLSSRVVAPPTTPPAASPMTVPMAPLSEPEPSSASVSPGLAVPAVPTPVSSSPGLETSGPLPPLPPPSPKAMPPAEGVISPTSATDAEVRPIPPLPPRPSPPNDSPTKPLSMRSLASADTQASLTSLATATDRSYATPERAPLSQSQQAGQAWTSDVPQLSPTQAGEASIGALALLPEDEQTTPIPPAIETDLVEPIEGSARSNEARSVSPLWAGWPTEPLLPCPRSQSDAQDLLENLGLDELDGSAPPSASSMYSEVSVERIESTEAPPTVWVPVTTPSPDMRDVAHGAVSEPGTEVGRSSSDLSPPADTEAPDGARTSPLEPLLLRAPPAHAVPSSESEPDSASTSATPLWMQRIRGRAVSAEPDPSPTSTQDGARQPTPPAPLLSDDDPLPSRPSEDDMVRGTWTPLRTSKSSSLLTAMSNQAHRIRRNVREAGLLLGDDEAGDDDSARGKGSLASRRSESTDVSIASPKSAGDLPALQKEGAPKSERPAPMYRTRRNKSQPTLRIADDLEFLHALEQVRLQHKERLALRQRARSARKASMPNLRPPPASRRPPLPMSRVASDRGAGEPPLPGRPRASSAADESLVAHMPGALDVSLTTPDVSTSFLELESLVSDDSASSEASGQDEVSTYASSNESEVISNELGIGHTTGNLPSAPFTNDDDWKKEVKALFLIRELVQTERSYAAHLESLLIVVLKWTGTSSTTRLPTNVLMPTTQSSSTSQPLRVPTPTPTTPTHLVTLRQMLPKLISVSRTLVYSIEESPTSEGVARSFLSMLERLEEVHVSWHGVVGSTLRSLRAAESSKSKVKGRLGRVPIAPPLEPPRRPVRSGSSSNELAESERRDKARAEPKELSAVDVAIMPTQRIPRYVLLLRDLLSYTSADTEAYATLEAALRAVQELGHRCDQASAPT